VCEIESCVMCVSSVLVCVCELSPVYQRVSCVLCVSYVMCDRTACELCPVCQLCLVR
jgi:hypothetical protein